MKNKAMEPEATIATKRPNTGNGSVIETAIFNNKKTMFAKCIKTTITKANDFVPSSYRSKNHF